jgi:hypothetical protein
MLNLIFSFLIAFTPQVDTITPTEIFYPSKLVFSGKVEYTNSMQVEFFGTRIVLRDTDSYFQKTFHLDKYFAGDIIELYRSTNMYLIEVFRYDDGEIYKITIDDNESKLTLLKPIQTR